MAAKKAKRPAARKSASSKRQTRNKKPGRKARLLWLIPVFFLAAAAFWLTGGPYLDQQQEPPAKPATPKPAAKQASYTPAPVFEEPLPAPSQTDRLRTLDEALFKALRVAGVDLSRVETRLSLEDTGEVTVLSVHQGPKGNAQALKQSLAQSLTRDGIDYAWHGDDNGEEMLVLLDGLPTHRLKLPQAHKPRAPAPPSPPSIPPAKPGPRPLAALVMDDLGYQMEPARRLLALKLPITFSILPHSPHGAKIAALAKKQGREVLLHLPMEPKFAALDPGPGALRSGMSDRAIRENTLADLESVPGAMGANNHMGSKLCEDPDALRAALGAIQERGLFFLDSRTTPDSAVGRVARELGLAWAQRDVFLDHDPKPREVCRQLDRFIYLAKKQGRIIAIGHPHPATLGALEKYRERLKKELKLVPVSELVSRP